MTKLAPIPAITLKAPCPHCGSDKRFKAIQALPQERYTRRCRCGTNWTITRTQLVATRPDGTRIDKLEWEC